MYAGDTVKNQWPFFSALILTTADSSTVRQFVRFSSLIVSPIGDLSINRIFRRFNVVRGDGGGSIIIIIC